MFRTIILGLATVATIAIVTVAAAVIGTAAASYALGKAALTVTTTIPATPQIACPLCGAFRQSVISRPRPATSGASRAHPRGAGTAASSTAR